MFAPPSEQAAEVASDIANELPSPYCPGRSIASCPSDAARDLEEDILEMLEDGATRSEVEQALVQRFGEEKMGSTRIDGVFIGVTVAAVLAVVGLIAMGRRWSRRTVPVPASKPSAPKLDGVSKAELDRLEDALDDVDAF